MLRLEAVACKDWLTNRVDRSVTGRIDRQQCQGELQLPLSDCGVVALDYQGKAGIATSIGHAPQAALADAGNGSVLAIAESLTNIVGAPLAQGLKSISLSANWMWPCRNEGEDAALYRAVKSCSDFACALGINIPTGKDSLSMTQKYGDKKVLAPGTVIISAAGEVSDIKKVVSPVIRHTDSAIYLVRFTCDNMNLGGSALFQTLNRIGANMEKVSGELAAIDVEATMRDINTTLANAKTFSAQLGNIATQLNTKMSSRDNTLGLMLNDRSLYDNLNHTVMSADSLMIDLKAHPKRYVHFSVFGKKDK